MRIYSHLLLLLIFSSPFLISLPSIPLSLPPYLLPPKNHTGHRSPAGCWCAADPWPGPRTGGRPAFGGRWQRRASPEREEGREGGREGGRKGGKEGEREGEREFECELVQVLGWKKSRSRTKSSSLSSTHQKVHVSLLFSLPPSHPPYLPQTRPRPASPSSLPRRQHPPE